MGEHVVEPHRGGPHGRHGGTVLLLAGGHDIVTGLEPAGGVPLGDRFGIGGRLPGQDGDHRGARVGDDQVGGAQCGIVEMG